MNIKTLNGLFSGQSAEQIIRSGFMKFDKGQIMTTSFGIEAALMLHLVLRVNPNAPVIFIDTGYAFPETYAFGLELVERLGIRNLKVYKPVMSPAEMEDRFGKLWESKDKESLDLYDEIRKTEPLRRALRELKVQSTLHGVRRYQNKDRNRLEIAVSGWENTIKIHPILNWSEDQVLDYFETYNLPFHPLKAEGYASVGDWHSTVPGEGRTGRWPGIEKDQCSLHVQGEKDGSGI